MGRPKGPDDKITIELQASPKLVEYLDELKSMEGFGESRQEIVKKFVWDGINKLILEARLQQK